MNVSHRADPHCEQEQRLLLLLQGSPRPVLVAAVLEPGVTERAALLSDSSECAEHSPSSLPLVGHSSLLLTPAGQARHCRALCSTAQGAVPRAEQGGKLKEQAPCKQHKSESLPSPLRCCSQEGFTCLSPSGRRRGAAEPPAAHPRVAGAVTPSLHAQRCARASECNKKERGCSERRKARGTTALYRRALVGQDSGTESLPWQPQGNTLRTVPKDCSACWDCCLAPLTSPALLCASNTPVPALSLTVPCCTRPSWHFSPIVTMLQLRRKPFFSSLSQSFG